MINRTVTIGKIFLGHELVSGTAFVFLGSIIGNILAFLFNLFLARTLSYADYAIFASLLSVITLASIPAGSINTVIVKFATNLFAKNEISKLKTLYLFFFKLVLGIALFISILFVLFSTPFKNYLHIENAWYIIVAGFVVSSTYLVTLNNAFLQSLLKFKFISFLNIFGNIIKIIVGIVLVILGLKAFGALGALFSMTIGMYLVAYMPLKTILKQKTAENKIALNITQMISYAVPASIAVISLTSFTSVDVILVKHFFPAHEAGFYAGLSLIGKVIFYFTAPIPLVMFPLIVKRHSIGKNYVNLLLLALLLVFVPSFTVTIFYFLFPSLVVNIFLGGRDYQEIAQYLGMFGIFITLFSMLNVCVNFFLSIGNIKATSIVIFGAILQIVLLTLFHDNFAQVIQISIAVCLMVLVGFLWNFYRLSKSL